MIGYLVDQMFEVDLIFGELDFWMIGYFVNLIFGLLQDAQFIRYLVNQLFGFVYLDVWIFVCWMFDCLKMFG